MTNPLTDFFISTGTAVDQALSACYLGSYAVEASGPQAYAHSKKWKIQEYRNTTIKIMMFFDYISCIKISTSLLSNLYQRVSRHDQQYVHRTLGAVFFLSATAASIYALKYGQKFHPNLHSDVYNAVKEYQDTPEDQATATSPIELEAGLTGEDLALQSIHLMKSIINFSAGCLLTQLSPLQRRLYFMSAMINSLSVGLLFQRVSLMFKFPEVAAVPDWVFDNTGDKRLGNQILNDGGEPKYQILVTPTVEYHIIRPLFERLSMSTKGVEDCSICLEKLHEKVAICANHYLHAGCIQEYCLSKFKENAFQQALNQIRADTIIIQEGGTRSPTASFFELIGCPSRAAEHMSFWYFDYIINKDARKPDLVTYDDRINPTRCVECRTHSPFYSLTLRITNIQRNKLPAAARYFRGHDQLVRRFGENLVPGN